MLRLSTCGSTAGYDIFAWWCGGHRLPGSASSRRCANGSRAFGQYKPIPTAATTVVAPVLEIQTARSPSSRSPRHRSVVPLFGLRPNRFLRGFGPTATDRMGRPEDTSTGFRGLSLAAPPDARAGETRAFRPDSSPRAPVRGQSLAVRAQSGRRPSAQELHDLELALPRAGRTSHWCRRAPSWAGERIHRHGRRLHAVTRRTTRPAACRETRRRGRTDRQVGARDRAAKREPTVLARLRPCF